MPTRHRAALLASLLFSVVAIAEAQEFDPFNQNAASTSPPQVLEVRSRADTSYQRGDYAKVIELADWLIQNYPNDNAYVAYHLRASAKVELGRASASAKQIREGISDARKALASQGSAFPWLHIPYLYGLSSLAEIERRPEHADLAIKVVTPVLNYPLKKDYTKDDRANLFYQRGLAYAAKLDYKSAVADQEETIRQTPLHLGAHIKRAEALEAMGQTKQALAALDDSVAKFPNEVLVFNERGKLRRTTGDLEGAIDDFSHCLSIDSKFLVGYLNRGLCLAEQNNPQAAEGEYSEALKLNPGGGQAPFAYRLRAAARLAQGNAAGAVGDYSAALKADPQNATLYEERGYARYFQKKFTDAFADFAKARELNPQLSQLIVWQSLAQARAGQAAEARTFLQTALADKALPPGWTAKVCSYLLDDVNEQELMDTAGAEARIKDKLLCEAHYFVGQKQLLRDDAAKAAEYFRQAIDSKAYELSAYRGSRYELEDFK
jgi:tetratricopeptide (TPR) repeat protein